MAVKKGKNIKKTKTVKEEKKQEKVNLQKEWSFVPYIFTATACFVIFTFFLDDTGWLGRSIKPFLRGLFGGGVFMIPFYLIVCALFWKRDKNNGMNGGKLVLCSVNFIFVMTAIHLLTASESMRSFKQEEIFVKVFYENGINLNGAGVIGGITASGMESLLGYWFTMILADVMAMVTFIFIFGSTPMRMIKKFIGTFKSIKIVPKETEKISQPEPIRKQIVEKPKKRLLEVEDAVEIKEKETQPVKEIEKEPEPVVVGVDTKRDEYYRPNDILDDYKKIFSEKDGQGIIIPEIENIEPIEDEITLNETAYNNENIFEFKEIEQGSISPYVFPPLSLLKEGTDAPVGQAQDISSTGRKLVEILETYGVKSTLVSTSCGPTVTRYEIQPAVGVRVNNIAKLSDDIRLRLAAQSIRIETNISGKAAVGIEVPNDKISMVYLRELISNPFFTDNPSKLLVCLGMDVGGNPVYFDIPDMPHLLVAGATGMGKSVCINCIIISLLYRATPDEVKFILIDPKKIELSCYNELPHLLVPVVYEPLKAAGSLNWAVGEMERRYTLMQEVGGVRNLKEYNEIIEGDEEREKLPNIVIIIDELADLIMSAPSEVETSICRLAQKARAAGIYLIIGTQRPSVDVITGLIKANIPSRIAFTVSSQTDSRTILNMGGADKLLGRGDMLYAPVKALKPIRVQGAYVDGQYEVAAVCNFIKSASQTSYDEEIIKKIEEESKMCGVKPSKRGKSDDMADEKEDPMFIDAIEIAFEFETMSTSLLQRRLSVGYARAQKMIDMMESRGYVDKFDTKTKKRRIIITHEEFLQLKLNRENSDD